MNGTYLRKQYSHCVTKHAVRVLVHVEQRGAAPWAVDGTHCARWTKPEISGSTPQYCKDQKFHSQSSIALSGGWLEQFLQAMRRGNQRRRQPFSQCSQPGGEPPFTSLYLRR